MTQNKKYSQTVQSKSCGARVAVRIALSIMLPIIAAGFYQQDKSGSAVTAGPAFKDDGQLIFMKHGTNAAIKLIQIEIADNEAARTQGLMWREYMPEDDGMLFIFDKQEPVEFWMKNTYIPLDMIFADRTGRIVSIYQEATPLSEASIPSEKPAKYVVEVNGGFCAKYGINIDNKLVYER